MKGEIMNDLKTITIAIPAGAIVGTITIFSQTNGTYMLQTNNLDFQHDVGHFVFENKIEADSINAELISKDEALGG